MVRILGISGSLRAGSLNTALLHAARQMSVEGVQLDIATLHGIPLYDGDLEQAQGLPPAVAALRDQILQCDGLLLATPEYNNGIPGVFKNAVDWLSRPLAGPDALFIGRPVALMGASPGGFGTILAQDAWLPVLRTLGTRFWSQGRLMVSRAGQAFDQDGALSDERARTQLATFLAGYRQFVAG